MVCLKKEGSMKVIVTVLKNDTTLFITISHTKPIETIFNEVGNALDYIVENIELTVEKGTARVPLSGHKDKTLADLGITLKPQDIINVSPKSDNMPMYYQDEDGLLLGASASPTTDETPSCSVLPSADEKDYALLPRNNQTREMVSEPPVYVGLVNQAMTCYLNSLIQALYMTPEFRNALYNWVFDGGQNEVRTSIPYQLQKLFLNLQTSSKTAVETTDLTVSFGWQGSEAWHQHDIQELCRVMFDALEQKFKDTKQANLINDLYEGKMLDYVKCLECGTEKSREDTFLDIPLPVRPFGSSVAYNSVEEALRAFVQPETLDGNNQYHCEKCNKKCDAYKGLKFTLFPYLLTLHLKRFDFDYNTMHRIKLYDKVVFPEILNLNSFIPAARSESDGIAMEVKESTTKCDDCSTTDSGSADDESCQGTDVSSTVNGQDDNCADSDEGIDVSSGNNVNDQDAKGPYMYELFSIMIHAGSASGGHYYAYIKDFDKNLWFCFNDQTVTGITDEDIKKIYGGGPPRDFYSGSYSASTNAYMLMYRQIDKERNVSAMKVEDFPPHIEKLLAEMHRKEEEERKNKEKENGMIKANIFFWNPNASMVQDCKVSLFTDLTLSEAAQFVHRRLKLDHVGSENDCRLVMYNKKNECIDYDFESEDLNICDIVYKNPNLKMNPVQLDCFLEFRKPGGEYTHYKRGGVNIRVYPVNLETEELEEPVIMRYNVDDTIRDVKNTLCEVLNMDFNNMKFIMNKLMIEDDDDCIIPDTENKFFVCCVSNDDLENRQVLKLQIIIERFANVISLNLLLPPIDVGILETLSIPSLDLNQNLDKIESSSGPGNNSPNLRVSPQPTGSGMCSDAFGDQSNSEDSSLSDSDRTLVGEAPGECIGLLSSNSNSPADQHMASPNDATEDTYNFVLGATNPFEEMNWDEVVDTYTFQESQRNNSFFFKITLVIERSLENNPYCRYSKCLKILVDRKISLDRFKKRLEDVLRVPSEYFKIFTQTSNLEEDWVLSDSLRTVKDGERLVVQLGRVVKKGEVIYKIYHLKLDVKEPNIFLFDHIIAKGQTVSAVKKEIMFQAKKQFMMNIPYDKCRLRERCFKRPKRVFLDDQKFGEDIVAMIDSEMFLQELEEPETVKSEDQIVVFIRHWRPSLLSLGPVQEIVVREDCPVHELKDKISEVSKIPLENLNLEHVECYFPCDLHVLEINQLEWNFHDDSFKNSLLSMDNGSMFFYRDKTEVPKELTPEERKELSTSENFRLGRPLKSVYSYSPRRERGLKIYLDTSPGKAEENFID